MMVEVIGEIYNSYNPGKLIVFGVSIIFDCFTALIV